ncbi:hypothetical protein ACWKW6_22795 [Dyadobacter jiangsuensis]
MRPRYFLSTDLLKPVGTAVEELETIRHDVNDLSKPYLIRGAFAYSFALFESTLKEYLKRYYLGFPENILTDIKKKKIEDIPDLFESTFSYEVVEKIIVQQMRDVSSEQIHKVLQRIEATFTSNLQILYDGKKLQEIKERRNLLMHSNLVVDKAYQVNTGIVSQVGDKLNITLDYLADSLDSIIYVLKQINKSASVTFADYTKEKLIKSVWEYFFRNVLTFEQVSRVRGDCLDFYPSDRLENRKSSLSGSERTLLSLFLLNYNVNISQRYYTSGDLNSQAGTFMMGELIELFDRYPLLLQQN